MKTECLTKKIKQLKLDLRRQIVEVRDGKVEVVMNGELKIITLILPDKIKDETLRSLKISLNKAIAKAQRRALAAVREITQ